MKRIIGLIVLSLCCAALSMSAAHPFVHPGLLQTRQDLEFMNQKVAAGEQPWKTAWSNLCSQPFSSLDFQPRPVAHVVRGPYGRPSIGDRELTASANAAYSHALQWVVTGDKAHAQKAIEILNAWSGTLWDFEDNDAKLLAAWTGHTFCNAAEILRYTNAGWKTEDIGQFKRMLLTVYQPLLKNYFPEANGNWDAAIINTLLCIGVFCDDHAIFEDAVGHFLRGNGNGGITRYIYPSGQCQESTRDQSHTQLGLGELAQACQVAWTQGVDLFGAADNRLALGFEYTARYLLGETNSGYGVISAEGQGRLSDIYEVVLTHYHDVKGFEMPFTARAVEKTRAGRTWNVLMMCRTSRGKSTAPFKALSPKRDIAGALLEPTAPPPSNAVRVAPGESIQAVLDERGTNGGWIVLNKGLHVLKAPLRIPSGVTLAGEGLETIVFLDPAVTAERAGTAIVNATDDMHDVTLRDFLVEGATTVRPASINTNVDYTYTSGTGSDAINIRPVTRDPNQDRRQRSYQMSPSRAGIAFSAQRAGEMRNLRLERLTVRNCTHNGVAIRGAQDVVIAACDFSDNGSSVVPGPGLQHNLLLTHVNGLSVHDSRSDDSLWGSGIEVSRSRDASVVGNETARNAANGVRVSDSENIRVSGNLVEGNDANGILLDGPMDGCREIAVTKNVCRNNRNYGVQIIAADSGTVRDNRGSDNGEPNLTNITRSKKIRR